MSKNSERLFLPSIAELVDQLSVNQIKEVLLLGDKSVYAEEIKKVSHDIDLLIQEKEIKISARLLRIIIVLAQMNAHIWHNKDMMVKDENRYLELLKLAHQLNGIRNQMKNLLLEEAGDNSKGAKRTNFNTDGLQGWEVSL